MNIDYLSEETPNLHRLYRNEILKIYNTIGFEPLIIFDMGANTGGMTSIFAEQFPNSLIHAFEPFIGNFEFLLENTKGCDNIIPHNIGFSNIDMDDVEIGMPRIPSDRRHNYGRSTRFYDTETVSIGKIQLKDYSKWCNDNGVYPDFIKLDVEGCEYEILKNAKDSGILQKTKALYVEINNTFPTAQLAKELLCEDYDIVADSGYNRHNFAPLNYVFKLKESFN